VAVTSGSLGLDAGGSFTGSASLTGAPGISIGLDGPFTFGPSTAVSVDTIFFDEYGGSYGGPGPTNVEGSYAASGRTVLQAGAHVNFTGTVVNNVLNSLDIVPTNGNASANFSPASPTTLSINECTLAGTLTGTDSFVITGPLTWSGGTLSTTGTTEAKGGMTITGGGLGYGTLNNYGTGTLSGSISVGNGAMINNLAGACFDIQGDVSLGYSGGAFAAFNNAGVLLKSSGTGVTHLQANVVNSGTVKVKSGTLDLASGAPLGTVNSGNVMVAAGATLRSAPYVQNGGATTLSGGTLSGGPFAFNAGVLSGSGTINANITNGGQVIPGGTGAIGTLTINGQYTQTTTGSLTIDLGGTTAGSQYNQLAVSGTATLGGTLNVSLINGFQPVLGNSFTALTFRSYANLPNSSGLVLGQGTNLSLAFGSSSAVLEVGDPNGSILVTNTNDAGPGSLRQAILNANAHPGADTVTFAAGVSGTIALNALGEPAIADGLTITGPGAQALTISGNGTVGVFQVDGGVTTNLSGLTISGGSATNGGGINNVGQLTVTGCTISNSNASNNGGGIDNSGTLTITGSTITSNGAGNNGGGVENTGNLLALTNSTIAENSVGNSGGGIDNAGTMTAVNTTIAYNVTQSLFQKG
jgi:hypothetical protein